MHFQKILLKKSYYKRSTNEAAPWAKRSWSQTTLWFLAKLDDWAPIDS